MNGAGCVEELTTGSISVQAIHLDVLGACVYYIYIYIYSYLVMRERSPCWKRWGRGFLSLLGLIGMCILVMLFAGHALLCALTLKNMRCRTKCSTFGAILIFLLLVLPFGTLLSAILIPFEIIIFIPVGLYYLFKNMLSQLVSSIRWHRRRTALQQELIVRNGL